MPAHHERRLRAGRPFGDNGFQCENPILFFVPCFLAWLFLRLSRRARSPTPALNRFALQWSKLLFPPRTVPLPRKKSPLRIVLRSTLITGSDSRQIR